jgi:hypothetical protein
VTYLTKPSSPPTADLSDEEILERLLALNLERSTDAKISTE